MENNSLIEWFVILCLYAFLVKDRYDIIKLKEVNHLESRNKSGSDYRASKRRKVDQNSSYPQADEDLVSEPVAMPSSNEAERDSKR